MKVLMRCFTLITILTIVCGCQKNYTGEYEQWGDTVETVDTKKLKKNDIPYKIKDNKVFIPEDAERKAIFCCT
ncbi:MULTISPECIES: hypothetical protein [Peribacillus]|uniref:Lipoprotein n=1 Tax=Peribacillus castrilensis TaxID=2897690 RepID=A0AAW9NL13_9BACI|nr:hypothetical protein [Peribacillus frigoritolerans]MEC0276248.1 hypothetical protein [Peribacillus castrilensis]MEC0299185.1 hypothetical protein [Peribacillus castrilensis]MEC0347422.1 hypothetical protein [Peribacillus castrilensis]TFH58127.1 hypothetical protein E4J71_25930 [Peribacillus frigoritolerans]